MIYFKFILRFINSYKFIAASSDKKFTITTKAKTINLINSNITDCKASLNIITLL